MKNQWFRMYAGFAYNPKVQVLSETSQRRYIMLLCLFCDEKLVNRPDDEISFALRITPDEWGETKAILIARGLINETLEPVGWSERQYVSDSSVERTRKYREKRRAEGKSGQVWIKKEIRNAVFKKYGNKCVYCFSCDDLTIDHKNPSSRGGDENPDNLQVACRVCNADKRHMTHDEYIAWNGRVTSQKRSKSTDTDTDTEADTERKKDKEASPSQKYFFEGKIIKLSEKDFLAWKGRFTAIPDFMEKLRILDKWHQKNKTAPGEWFWRVERSLSEEHQKLTPAKQLPENERPYNRIAGPAGG